MNLAELNYFSKTKKKNQENFQESHRSPDLGFNKREAAEDWKKSKKKNRRMLYKKKSFSKPCCNIVSVDFFFRFLVLKVKTFPIKELLYK